MPKRRKRKQCRAALRVYTWIFAVLFFASPFVVMGDAPAAAPSSGIFGLDPELVKILFQGSVLVSLWLLVRVLTKVDRSQNMLHQNDRELARVLTQITTAHNINHGQQIEPPRIGEGEGMIL